MPRRGRSGGDSLSPVPPKRVRASRSAAAASSRLKRDKALGGDQDGRRRVLSDEEFREKNKNLIVESIGSALKVKSFDLMKEKNRESHHTDEFEQDDLIIRRGQAFSLEITFDRNPDEEADIIALMITTGQRPQESKGTLIRIPLSLDKSTTSDAVGGWEATVQEIKGKTMVVSIMTEPDSNIGRYAPYVETKLKDSSKEGFTRYEYDGYIYMLFNPWCKEDVVYMEKEEERHEYVLNDVGRIWIGSKRCHYGRPWIFGQFETPVLDTALLLLDKGELADSARNSVSSIIRCLSALTNSMDDEGLLEGRWTSEYPKNCTKPWEWTGSAPIIEQYYEKGKPVQYGQCWVFSGVITTLCRCLGIPTRSVTNFESAHDTDCSMTIDMHFDDEGEPMEELNDSVWNFHVWNESCYRRLDLPAGYDGWQAHDATPQESSEGVMRCGPAPLAAIKKGHVYLSFDVGFIFAEVNGDKIEWEVKEDGSMEVCYIDKFSVGRKISTKAVGSDERHDLTWDYKYFDGSEDERKVVEFVNRFSKVKHKKNIYKKDQKAEIELDIVEPEDKFIGDDIEVGVKVKNVTDSDKNVKVHLTMASTFYTGVVGKKVQGEKSEHLVKAGEEKEVLMSVSADSYEAVMNAEGSFKLTASCRVLESKRLLAATETFTLKKPSLEFEIPDRICSYVETKGKLKFKNRTNLKLHNGVFHVEGSYIVKAKTIHIRKVIHPDDEISVDFTMMPRRLRNRLIYATFSADEVTDFVGETSVFVVSKSEWEEEEKRKEEKEEEEVADEDEADAAGETVDEKVEKEEMETDGGGGGEERMEEGGGDTNENTANENEEAPVENGGQDVD